MKYLAIFVWHESEGATWSDEFNTLDKEVIANQLMAKGEVNLDYAEILVIENGGENPNFTVDPMETQRYLAPKVVAHWSALNGDFEGM